MSKFKLIEDIYILDSKVLSKNDEIIFDVNNQIEIKTEFGIFSLTKEKLKDRIIETTDIDVKISILDESDNDAIRLYRMQLDVRTSRRKLIEIEKYLREYMQEIL